jgi:hypothetical protein
MLCFSDSIRHDDPSMQQLLNTIEKAQTLTQLILAVAVSAFPGPTHRRICTRRTCPAAGPLAPLPDLWDLAA